MMGDSPAVLSVTADQGALTEHLRGGGLTILCMVALAPPSIPHAVGEWLWAFIAPGLGRTDFRAGGSRAEEQARRGLR